MLAIVTNKVLAAYYFSKMDVMALSTFKKLNEAFTTLHTAQHHLLQGGDLPHLTLNKNREGKEGQIAGEDYDWQLQTNDWDEVEWSVRAGQGACLQAGRGGPWAEQT